MRYRTRHWSISRWIGASIVVAGLACLLMPAEPDARDADESRLGAEEHPLGTSHNGDLAPPDDEVDWRYIKVEQAETVSFSLAVSPEKKAGTLTLTRATGDELDQAETDEGSVEFDSKLSPGLYYVKVAASAKIDYTLSISGS